MSYLKYYLFQSSPDLNNQIGFLILVMVFMFFSFGLLFKLKLFSFKLSIIGLVLRLITLCITAYFVMHFYEQAKQDTSASFYEWIHRDHSPSEADAAFTVEAHREWPIAASMIPESYVQGYTCDHEPGNGSRTATASA